MVTTKKNSINTKLAKNTIPRQHVGNLIALLNRTAINSVWEQSLPCPCINPETNQPRLDCKHCLGKGIIFRKPRIVAIAFQSNEKDTYSGAMGERDMGTTIATPAPTENRIEDGISFRDRITPMGLTLTQTYIVNITEKRFKQGVVIPYNVYKFNTIMYEDKNKELQTLEIGGVVNYDKTTSRLTVSDKNLIGKSLTMSLSVALRYYVVDIAKEVRTADVNKIAFKKELEGTNTVEVPLNKDDPEEYENLTNFSDNMQRPDIDSPNGDDIYRLPKKLILRREDLYIPMQSFDSVESSESDDAPYSVIDSKEYKTSSKSPLSMFTS